MDYWQLLQLDGRALMDAIQSLHRASQILAMVSHAYIPHLPDDSHNTFVWNTYTSTLEGRWIDEGTVQLKLDIPNFELIVDKYDCIDSLTLAGKTSAEVLEWIKKQLASAGLNVTKLLAITHFSVPHYAQVDSKIPFAESNYLLLEEWAKYLTNTQILLKEVQHQFNWASEVRVWPHHFDMGLYIPVDRDASGNDSQSIGVGLAIPDPYSPEPYFYINHWSKSSIVYPDILPEIRLGFWNKIDWTGLVLPSRVVVLQSNQESVVREFFHAGIQASLDLLNLKSSEFTHDIT